MKAAIFLVHQLCVVLALTGSSVLYHVSFVFDVITNLPPLFNRPMKNSDINLMDDNQNEWGDDDPDCRRFRVRGIF